MMTGRPDAANCVTQLLLEVDAIGDSPSCLTSGFTQHIDAVVQRDILCDSLVVPHQVVLCK